MGPVPESGAKGHSSHRPLPTPMVRRQKDPRHQFARWLLELETIPYTIAFRPGSSNLVSDYLSRVLGPTVDWEVNEESRFEDKIYQVETVR